MNGVQMVELTVDEMKATSGGSNWRCWAGGFLVVGGVYTMNPLIIVAGFMAIHDNC